MRSYLVIAYNHTTSIEAHASKWPNSSNGANRMLFISKRYLCIHRSNEELNTIEKAALRELLEVRPSNTIYFETTDGKFYGLVTHGDISKAQNGMVPINKSFVSLSRSAYMEARERFRQANNIYEIPVVQDGQLIGEFHKFDDELMIERTRAIEYNAHASAFFAKLKNVALVKPTAPRAYKMRYFEKLEDAFKRFTANFTVVEFTDMVVNCNDFDAVFVVDEQERRGAKILLELFEHQPSCFNKVFTMNWLLTKLESSGVADFNQLFFELEQKGVEALFLTTKSGDSDYVVRTKREMEDRYPVVDNNLNRLLKPYEAQFFDDLYENKELVREIKANYFVVEKIKESFRLMDIESNYINIHQGERRTVGQPDDYTRSIYFFGPCLIIGAYVSDECTIESYLQAMINKAGYKARVVNCGCWGGNIASISRLLSTFMREGDIVIMLLEDLETMSFEDLKTIDLWSTLEKNLVPSEWMLDGPYHVNHHVSELYAKDIFNTIFNADYQDNSEDRNYITQSLNVVDKFFIQKYFYGEDLARFDKVACCVFNGNPFTNGHRHLIETASHAMDHVYLLSVKEDSSIFSFNERYAMAVDATSDLDNVTVVPSGLFIGNIANFPAYYAKMYVGNAEEQVQRHVEAFASIATLLHTTHRFVGEEPTDPVAYGINEASKRILPGYGIETVVVERQGDANGTITGSRVRELAKHDDPEIANLVPKATADIIRCTAINAF